MRLVRTLLVPGLALGLALGLAGCSLLGDSTGISQATEIAWRDGDVEDALAEAKESGKPVFLYWGAVWCPPCNQMKATLFKDRAFIAETEKFVPVYLDGDSEGAQRWGERFGISGYPTVIILQPDGTEITRIASATMASDLPELLRVAARRTTSIEALLAKAEADTAGLSADDWRILGGFDWLNDPKHFEDLAKAGTLLDRLADSAPDPALQRHFSLLALAVNVEEGADGKLAPSAAQQAEFARILPQILASKAEIEANRQLLIYSAADLVAAHDDPKQADALGKSLLAAMDAIHADTSLAMTDRLDAIYSEIVLAEAKGEIPPEVLAKVQARVAWADKNAKDQVTRESLIDGASDLLFLAGDSAGAKRLLEAEIKRSATPFYYMSGLAKLAEEEGDTKGAIEWARKAYEGSQGAATRVQWAISYSGTVMRLAPDDTGAVAESAGKVLDELAKSPDSYFQRTRVKVNAWGDGLRAWSEKNGGGKVLEQLRTRMADICSKEATAIESCRNWSRAA